MWAGATKRLLLRRKRGNFLGSAFAIFVCMLYRRIALVVPRERVWNAEKEERVLQTPEGGMHASYSSGGETSGMSDVEAKSSS